MWWIKWFLSSAVREAVALRQQVHGELNAQRDLLTPKAVQEVKAALGRFSQALRQAPRAAQVRDATRQLDEFAVRWLKAYPEGKKRENIKEFLVSGVLILTIFNFFLQPMKIPSGSAQPTLYGNVITDLRHAPAGAIPGFWGRIGAWFQGDSYYVWRTQSAGELSIGPVQTFLGFIKRQTFTVGQDSYSIYWPPEDLAKGCGVIPGQSFHRGELVLQLRISSGDRLFVDKVTYNFRRPKRGEIIVFKSTGILGLIQHTHYIKRLIGLGGDHVSIGDDRHVRINGVRLDSTTPHFENLYSFSGPPRPSVYSGHVNDHVAVENGFGTNVLARLFPAENAVFVVRPRHYLAFGDNTMNSFDGRSWGDFTRSKVVGKARFVFWPLTSRFGLVNR